MRAPIRVSSRSGSPTLIFWVRFTISFVKTSSIFLSTNTRVPLQHTWDAGQAAQSKIHGTPQSLPAQVLLTEALRKAPLQLLNQLTCPWGHSRLDYPAAHRCGEQSVLDLLLLMPRGSKSTSSHQQERALVAISVPSDDPSKPICQ